MTLLQLYLPHRTPDIKPQTFKTFEEYVRTEEICNALNENRHRYELNAENLEQAWNGIQEGKIQEDAWAIIAPEAESERLDIELEKQTEPNTEIEEIPELEICHHIPKDNSAMNPNIEFQKPNLQ